MLAIIQISYADWTVELEYSLDDFTSINPLGRIELRRSYEGNYTGSFRPALDSNLGRKLSEGSDNIYRIRAKSSTQPSTELLSYSKPCLILQSKLFHLFWIAIDADRQLVHSVTVFPDWVAVNDTPDVVHNCGGNTPISGEPYAVVHVSTKVNLPSPDTQAFVLKMEKERRARQHGAEQDNRSFLTKYWMYIVPVVLFMVVSNALSPEQSSNGEQ